MLAFPHISPFAPIHLRTSFPSIVTLLVNTPTLQFPRCLPTHLISSTSPEGSRGPAIKPLSILQKSPIYSLQSRESPSSLFLLASPSCRTFLSPHCTAFFSLHTSLASLHDTTFTILEAIHNQVNSHLALLCLSLSFLFTDSRLLRPIYSRFLTVTIYCFAFFFLFSKFT